MVRNTHCSPWTGDRYNWSGVLLPRSPRESLLLHKSGCRQTGSCQSPYDILLLPVKKADRHSYRIHISLCNKTSHKGSMKADPAVCKHSPLIPPETPSDPQGRSIPSHEGYCPSCQSFCSPVCLQYMRNESSTLSVPSSQKPAYRKELRERPDRPRLPEHIQREFSVSLARLSL